VLRKAMAVTVIILFMGVGIQPAFAINHNNADKTIEIIVSRYRADRTIEKTTKMISKEKALDLKNILENIEDKNDTLSILQDYNIVSEDITDEQLYNEMLKSAEGYDFSKIKNAFLKMKIYSAKDEMFFPIAINFLCKITSNAAGISIPIGLSIFTSFINFLLMILSILGLPLLYFLLPSVDIFNFHIGNSDFECYNGILPDFVVDVGFISMFLLVGFIGFSICLPFVPFDFNQHFGYCLFTFAAGDITIDWPIPKTNII
jgi:hypothetical protein